MKIHLPIALMLAALGSTAQASWQLIDYQKRLESISVGTNADGRLEVFSVDRAGQLWHEWELSGSSAFSGWVTIVKPPVALTTSAPGVGRNANGQLEAICVGSDGNLWQIGQWDGWSSWTVVGTRPNASAYPYSPMTALGNVVLANNADGRLEAFFTAYGVSPAYSDFSVWHTWETSVNGHGAWSTWQTTATFNSAPKNPGNEPAVAMNADGRLELFSYFSGGLWHAWQWAPNSTWSDWQNLGHSDYSGNRPAVAVNSDGRLEAMIVFNGGTSVAHIWQVAPGSSWSSWETIENWVSGATDPVFLPCATRIGLCAQHSYTSTQVQNQYGTANAIQYEGWFNRYQDDPDAWIPRQVAAYQKSSGLNMTFGTWGEEMFMQPCTENVAPR